MKTKALLNFVPRLATWCIIASLLIATSGSGVTLLVYNTNNAGAGSLRQALQDNAALGGGNQIVFSNVVTGTITLTGGQLNVTASVDIVGPGADFLAVSGNSSSRIFMVTNGVTASISGLTISRGYNTTASGGGGILNYGVLLVSDCVLTNLTSSMLGAGIMNYGTLTLRRSTVRSCSGPNGGLYNSSASATVTDSTFTGNAIGGGNGGAAFNSGTLTMTNCTLVANSAGDGGGVFSSGTLTLVNCTISGNTAGPASGGGGVKVDSGSGFVRSCIIAGNTTGGIAPDVYGSVTSGGYNLIGKTNGATGFGALADQLGTTNSPLNPLLGSLQDNGGPTPTMSPQPGSLAIDQGKSAALNDQRGRGRQFDDPSVPNAPLGDGSDIGAVEIIPTTLVVSNANDSGIGSLRQTIQSAGSVDGDTITFAPGLSGTITLTTGELGISKPLRIVGPGARTLAINGNANDRVFELLQGTVAISGLTICNGRVGGTAGGFEQNGGEARGGGIFNQTTLALSDCILSNNVVVGGQGGPTDFGFAGGGGNSLGGAIANIGALTLTNCYLVANSATGGAGGVASGGGSDGNGGQAYGGGIYSFTPVTFVRCTFAKNIANGGAGGGGTGSGSGGGIFNEGEVVMLTCTVSSNSAGGSAFDFGGGIYHNGPALTLRSSTVAGNQADYGGGLYLNGAADCGNTVLAYNVAGSGPDCSGTINSSDYNLIQNTSDLTITGTTTHNLTGQNPLLASLADNGGLSPTLAPRAGSPVIDKGKNFGLTTDERGAPRPFDFATIANAASGDGSDIGAFESGSPKLAIQQTGGAALLSWPSHYGGFTVQSVTNIVLSNAWTTVVGSPVVSGNQYVFTNSPITGNKFYRLKGN